MMKEEAVGRKHPIHTPAFERFNAPVIIFVTLCTKDRKPLLANPEAHAILRDVWAATDAWFVGRYVIMPDHLHLFCSPTALVPQTLESWIKFWKSVAARRWPRREEAPIWQRHFWDRQLRRGEGYDAKWDYVVANPVRAGFVVRSDDWPYQGEMYLLRW